MYSLFDKNSLQLFTKNELNFRETLILWFLKKITKYGFKSLNILYLKIFKLAHFFYVLKIFSHPK